MSEPLASEGTDPAEGAEAGTADVILDYITGRELKDTAKERVRQRIARALFHEYGLSVEDMEPDFPINVGEPARGGKARSRKVEIAIFAHGSPHTPENLRRVVVCRIGEPVNDAERAVLDQARVKQLDATFRQAYPQERFYLVSHTFSGSPRHTLSFQSF